MAAIGAEYPPVELCMFDKATVQALAALVVWRKEGTLGQRDAAQSRFGTDEGTLRRRIIELGEALGLEGPLIKQEPNRRYRLTALGLRLASLAPRILDGVADLAEDMAGVVHDHPLEAWPRIRVGCFNAAVKLFVARALRELARPSRDFEYVLELNRDMNLRTVNGSVLLDDSRGRNDYAVAPWPSVVPPPDYRHLELFTWRLMVVAPEQHPLRERESVTVDEVWAACRDPAAMLPLLLSPPFNVSRLMVDGAFAQRGRFPLESYVVENPDTYTRYELAVHGHGIAITTADSLPDEAQNRQLPILVDGSGMPLQGLYTLAWRPGSGGDGSPPTGINAVAHEAICQSIKSEAAAFAARRKGCDPR